MTKAASFLDNYESDTRDNSMITRQLRGHNFTDIRQLPGSWENCMVMRQLMVLEEFLWSIDNSMDNIQLHGHNRTA